MTASEMTDRRSVGGRSVGGRVDRDLVGSASRAETTALEGEPGVTADAKDQSFERWALLGALALAVVGFAAFLSQRGARSDATAGSDSDAPTELLRVRIGGPRTSDNLPGVASDASEAPDGPQANDELHPDPHPGPDENAQGDAAARTRIVTVRAGETLGQLVERELGTVSRMNEVIELNGIDDPDRVRAGTELLFPVE
jgi:nucleoid-associated protein YgaU